MGVHIEGVEDCLKMFDNAPANAVKICTKAMRAGARASANHIRKATPKRWRKLVKSRGGKLADGSPWARAGLYNNKQATGRQSTKGKDPAFDWFKAYWANYGTLSRRDPTHQFQYKIKPKSKERRQSVGQPAQNFFEKAIVGWEEKFVDAFYTEVERNKDDMYQR
ncbi:MAG: hypothetical protein II289_00110 [Bacteroidales bacterium]|nr:hypothetical protein [Bacteroidales bacterium]